MYKKIMALLKERNETMSDLAREAGIPYTSLKNMEYREGSVGGGGLSVKNLKKVAKHFGITLDELCEGVEI